jgi:hypothetical protein
MTELINVVVYDKTDKNIVADNKGYSFINAQASFVDILLLAQRYTTDFPIAKYFQLNLENIKVKSNAENDILIRLNEINNSLSQKNLFIQTSVAFRNYVENLLQEQKESMQYFENELQNCANLKQKFDKSKVSQEQSWQMFIQIIYNELLQKPIPENISFDILKENLKNYKEVEERKTHKIIEEKSKQLLQEKKEFEEQLIDQCLKENQECLRTKDEIIKESQQQLTTTIFQLTQETEKLNQMLKQMKKEKDVCEQENIILKEKFTKEMNTQKQIMEQKEKLNQMLKYVKEEKDVFEKENVILSQSVKMKEEKFTEEVKKMNKQIVNLTHRRDELQNRLQESDNIIQQLRNVCLQGNEQLNQLQQTNEQMKILFNENEHLKKERDNLYQQHAEIYNQLQECQNQITLLQQQEAIYQMQLNEQKDNFIQQLEKQKLCQDVVKKYFGTCQILHSFINQVIQILQYEGGIESLNDFIIKHLKNYIDMKQFFNGDEILLLNSLKNILNNKLDELVLDQLKNERQNLKKYFDSNASNTFQALQNLMKKFNNDDKITLTQVENLHGILNVVETIFNIKSKNLTVNNLKWAIYKIFFDMCQEMPVLLQPNTEMKYLEDEGDSFETLLSKVLSKIESNQTLATILKQQNLSTKQIQYICLKIIDTMFIGPINLINDYNLDNFNLHNYRLVLTSNQPSTALVPTLQSF